MEGNKSLELHLTEAELETLINAIHSTYGGRFAELEFKLRAAWRRALSQSDYRARPFLTLVDRVRHRFQPRRQEVGVIGIMALFGYQSRSHSHAVRLRCEETVEDALHIPRRDPGPEILLP